MQPEDVQNRVRNILCSIKLLNDIVKILVGTDADSEEAVDAFNYLVKSDLPNKVDQSINKLIKIGEAIDLKINDSSFDIEKYMIQHGK